MDKSHSKNVYSFLLDKIISGAYLPGQIINRRMIAGELGVSVSPVTEAMVMLESEGFLETLPRKGTQVRMIRDEDIAGYLFLREMMECGAVRLVCGERVRRNRERLKELGRTADQAQWRSMEYYYADKNFHQALIDLCENPVISKEYARVSTLGLFFTPPHVSLDGNMLPGPSHEGLVDILADSNTDPEVAARLLHRHIIFGKGALALTR